jgi:hypothetical protein
MISTSTRFRRRPSRLPGQPFRLALKDPLPGAKVQSTLCDRDHDFAAHDLPLQMRVGIVLAGAVVQPAPGPAMADRCVWRQPFKPHLVIVVQATLVVVDEYAGRNVLRIYQGQYLPCGIPHSYH